MVVGWVGCRYWEQPGRIPAVCAPGQAAGESRRPREPRRHRAVRFDTAVRSHFDQC